MDTSARLPGSGWAKAMIDQKMTDQEKGDYKTYVLSIIGPVIVNPGECNISSPFLILVVPTPVHSSHGQTSRRNCQE